MVINHLRVPGWSSKWIPRTVLDSLWHFEPLVGPKLNSPGLRSTCAHKELAFWLAKNRNTTRVSVNKRTIYWNNKKTCCETQRISVILKITSELIMHFLGLIIMHCFLFERFSNLRISLTPLLAARCSSLQCESKWCHHRWRFCWRSSSRLATGVPWTSKSNKLTRYAPADRQFISLFTLPETNIAMENPPFWWYLPGKMGVFMGYVSFREGTWFYTSQGVQHFFHQQYL